MRTILRAVAVATAAVAAVAGTAGAANAAPRNHASLTVPHTVKAHHFFEVKGSGYDGRTRTGVLCLQQRQFVNHHWGNWQWELCEAHRSGHSLSFTGFANHGLPAGTYDMRLVLFSNPSANVWKPLDASAIHKIVVR